MSKILGLDLGTNSIGWSIIDSDEHKIINAGSRIVPMDAATLGDYETGNLKSQASVRTDYRGIRRLYERAKLRRERLLRVLHVMGFLPKHFDEQIDFANHLGQFINHGEPLLPYRRNADGKNEFVFIDSFNEMLQEFHHAHADDALNNKKIPHDWTIYYLRHKALSRPITREELAWIILQFNTKRGYYQLRGEEEETKTATNEEYMVLTVSNVEMLNADKKRRGINWYEITYDNGAIQRKSGPAEPRQAGDRVELIVTTTLDKDGNVAKDKEGNPKIKLRDPKPDDWALMKKRTEATIEKSGMTVGDFIYNTLLHNPEIKIRGKQVRTIERKYYKDELKRILEKQSEFIPELKDSSLLERCVRELYRSNEAHVKSLHGKSFADFVVNDIIFYQRPLRSKKSLIANCPFETYSYKDKQTGEERQKPIKVIPKSHPLYQEFRLRQFMQNLKVIEKEKEINGKLRTDVDVTNEFLRTEDDWQRLYDHLSSIKNIDDSQFCKYLGINPDKYRWNYVTEKSYPCAETHCAINPDGTLDKVQETELWHIMYSVSDPIDLRKALSSFARKNALDEQEFVESHVHIKPFDNDYGAFSEKALKKILPLMRRGADWNIEDLPRQAFQRMQEIIDGTEDDRIKKQIAKNQLQLESVEDFKNLPLWFAEYLVYGEKDNTPAWKSPGDIDKYLRFEFGPNSLRNPVVEMVLGETLRVVRDIWKDYGKPDEIHVEMGRDLKQPKDKRVRATQRIRENEHANLRIRRLLQEFAASDSGVENVRPNSPSQMEILKIYESDVLDEYDKVADPDDKMRIVDEMGDPSKHVSHDDVIKYKCWLEQRYQSPYTGEIIPLSKLFTTDYEIEHIIPQSRYFDDSLNNKVICESCINKLKGNRLGYEFILKEHGRVEGNYTVFEKEAYEQFVKDHYANNPRKARILLLEDIPDSFVQRQLNDSRYIARKTAEILSAVVRQTDADGTVAANDRGSVSINLIPTNGAITDKLKKEWGITQIWNHIIAPRFIRLNDITQSEAFGSWVSKDGERYFQINVPLEQSAGFSKKRIDHRHHAMDAIVIACTTRDIINYLNNSAAKSDKQRYDLRAKLCFKDKTDDRGNYVWRFQKPWDTFTEDTKNKLNGIVVCFKQNLRVINKTSNHFWHYENGKKILARQTKGDGWALRKSLHKATVSGAVRLQTKKTVKLKDALANWHLIANKNIRKGIKHVVKDLYKGKIDQKTLLRYFKDRGYKLDGKDISKVDVWYTPKDADATASRTRLDESFDKKNIAKITDSGIRQILLRHIEANNGDPKIAFSAEGIARMNENIRELNGGKDHKPILSVRKYESMGTKFNIGDRGAKATKFVEADKGTNLFFAIYSDGEGNRSYDSIPFNIAVERQKQGIAVAPDTNADGDKLLFTLSPGDLVYMPDDGEHVDMGLDKGKIWKFVSCTKKQGYFIPERIASIIADKQEYTALNKTEFDDAHRSIKAYCRKLTVDRLGNITKIE